MRALIGQEFVLGAEDYVFLLLYAVVMHEGFDGFSFALRPAVGDLDIAKNVSSPILSVPGAFIDTVITGLWLAGEQDDGSLRDGLEYRLEVCNTVGIEHGAVTVHRR